MKNSTHKDKNKHNDSVSLLNKISMQGRNDKRSNDAFMSIMIEQVIAMINDGDDDWELLLSKKEVKAIKQGNLFGYHK